ncbi:MAG TPA: 16S rRNA (guanine(527)-N(7))-methyltransferase RsmG [Casimicrobiaceae bacterium]|nr:16S rRNA (guanine(527)-N(7))-methyltransferase RsmG [Casimicrobiaceae bacterium]
MSAAPPGKVADSELAERIAAAAIELALPLEAEQVSRLVAYLRLIERWNETYNLTSIRDPGAMATQHIVDSLAAAAALRRRRAPRDRRQLVDVGSGAGLPGVVIAIALPETQVVCVDSVGKKAAFITQAAGALGARNVTSVHARIERLKDHQFDVVASRAFGSLPDFVAGTRHVLAENAEWLAMKGKTPAGEIATLAGIESEIEPLEVPGLAANRCIVWMHPSHE